MPSTTGTNTAATRSASRWMGAREPCASSTSLTMRASVVSLPTRVARKHEAPGAVHRARRTTLTPAAFSTGRLSPVSIDSSTRGRALDHDAVDRHPLARPDADEVTDATVGRRHVHLDAVADARARCAGPGSPAGGWPPMCRPRARASSQRPSTTRVITTAAVS